MSNFIIDNVDIYDGSGLEPVLGSVAVSGDRITAVGQVGSTMPVEVRIDGKGLALAPGIIDSHTHFDAQVTWDPMVTPSPEHGVTTALIGNCGFTIAPCHSRDRELTMQNLVRVEGMSLEAMRAGINWGFESFNDYLALIERQGVGPNIAAFVGHSSVRTYVMGSDAPLRSATVDEVESMRRLVAAAMDSGAVGFATSTSPSHNGADGNPMPSRLAEHAELEALVGVLGDKGRGVFMLTKGGPTPVPFLETLAADTGRPVVVAALLHNSTDPDAVFNDLEAITAAQGRGQAMWGQVSACPLSTEFTLLAPYPFEALAAWKPAMQAASPRHFRDLVSDALFRDSIRQELKRPAAVRLFNGEWEKLQVLEVAKAKHRHYEGQSVASLAAAARVDPLDFMFDLALSEELETTFLSVLLNSDESAVARLLTHEYSTVALSDAGAHLTFFCDAGFGLHLMGHWVRDRQIMPLTEAIRRLTSHPAEIFGIRDRGRIEVGAFADLLLFDPDTVGRGPSRRVWDLPAEQRRLTTDPLGVHGVWVNGTRIVNADGVVPIDKLPGKVLREF